jgi:transcriptional regulator with XRE-family HTH domain
MNNPELVQEDYKTNLQYRRALKRITQKDLAERSGVNLRMIQHYEQGFKDINTAAALTVYKLAEALDCTVGNLLEI